MKKTNKGFLILIVILVVLILIYAGLRAWNSKKSEQKKKQEEAARIYVTDISADKIVSLQFNTGNGEIEFIKEDGTWYDASDRDFPLDQSYPEDMADTLSKVEADRKLENGDSLADYGLDDPVYTIAYTDTDGNTVQLRFGNTADDDYYATVGEEGTVYTVSSTVIDPFNHTLDDMASLDDYPSIGSGNLQKEVITENGKTTTYDRDDEDQSEDIAAIAGGLGAVTLSEAADYSVDDQDLSKYGLDEGSRITVEVTYTENDKDQTMTLYMGNSDNDGKRYVMINDSRIVYLISDEICNNILNN